MNYSNNHNMSTENTGKFAKEFDNYVISTGNGNTIPAPK